MNKQQSLTYILQSIIESTIGLHPSGSKLRVPLLKKPSPNRSDVKVGLMKSTPFRMKVFSDRFVKNWN